MSSTCFDHHVFIIRKAICTRIFMVRFSCRNYNKRLYKYLSLNCWSTLHNCITMYGTKKRKKKNSQYTCPAWIRELPKYEPVTLPLNKSGRWYRRSVKISLSVWMWLTVLVLACRDWGKARQAPVTNIWRPSRIYIRITTHTQMKFETLNLSPKNNDQTRF